MSEKEYIVSLNKGVDYAAFNQEMIAATGAGDIPARSVDIANARPASQRNTHYSLTNAEAELLSNDPRVYAVTLLPELDPDIGIGFDTTQTGVFTKTTLDRGDFLNWGMRRMNETINPYTGVNAAAGGYNYTLDGSGVDVVIMDSGLQIDHPEFQDANGVSRVVELDWTTASGIAGMPAQNINYYRDHDGHGTHVAGTAVGKTYGWAKNAKIYAVKLAGLEGTGDSGTGTSATYVFDCIKEWHNAKPNDAATGAKRPTVVNMSWGYLRYYDTVTSMTYQGASKTGTDIDSTSKRWAFGLPAIWNGVRYATNLRIGSVDVDMEELIDAGVHVMVAAGNRSHKVDVESGADYDNVLVANTGSVNYQRGSSPYSVNAHIVGNIDSTINAGGLEQKSVSSEAGPGVSVYAPGTDIMSAMSTTNKFGATILNNPYPPNSNFLINNISGTSMASPQITGMTALWLQLNPSATPAQALAFVNSTSKTAKLYDTASSVDYTDTRSLLGATNRFAFNKFNSATQLTMGTIADAVAPGAVATYSLSSSAANVNEGSSVTITLTTTNITDGTTIGYLISGIESGDISESLTGNFTVTGNTATITFNVVADATTEGAQTMLLSLVGISSSVSVTVNDTSTTPLVPAYAVAPAANNVDEGSALTFNVTTTNVADATTLYWTATNAADFSTSSGSFTITSNAGSVVVTPTADTTTEGAETFTLQIRTVSISGTVVATSSTVTINDTSTTPGGSESYSLAASSTSLQEGEKTTFTLTTANVANATSVPYTITGVNSSDLNTGPRSSSAIANTVGYGSNFFTREIRTAGVRIISAGTIGGQTAVPDAWLEKVARMYQLFTDSAGAGINENKQEQLINTLLGNTTSYHSPKPTIQRVARGGGASYTPNFLTDAGIMSWGLMPLFDETVQNDMVWYLNSSGTPGTGDYDAQEVIEHVFHTLHMHGLDAATLKMYPAASADWATSDLFNAMKEAEDANYWDPSGYAPNWKTDAETFEVGVKEYLYLLNFCMFDYSTLWEGNSLAPEWSDSLRTPAGIQANNPLGYALFNTNIGDVISKPSLATIRNIFQDGDVGNPTVAGASGYVADTAISLTGNFTVNSNTATLEINTAKDGTTDGDKTLALTLDNAAATQNVSITDSSQNVGSTYFAYPAAMTIDEGSALTINVVTTDQSDGTLYWTIGSNASDFSLTSGNFAITSDNGSFIVTPTADAGTEGAETFTIQIRTGSISGNIVFTTPAITINDTSLTPTADYTINVGNNGASDYTLSGTDRNGSVSGNDPALAFNNGDVVDFVVSASGHPFWIKTAQVTGTGSGATGVSNNGTQSGTVQWTVGSTGTFYYICQYHAGMVGTITAS